MSEAFKNSITGKTENLMPLDGLPDKDQLIAILRCGYQEEIPIYVDCTDCEIIEGSSDYVFPEDEAQLISKVLTKEPKVMIGRMPTSWLISSNEWTITDFNFFDINQIEIYGIKKPGHKKILKIDRDYKLKVNSYDFYQITFFYLDDLISLYDEIELIRTIQIENLRIYASSGFERIRPDDLKKLWLESTDTTNVKINFSSSGIAPQFVNMHLNPPQDGNFKLKITNHSTSNRLWILTSDFNKLYNKSRVHKYGEAIYQICDEQHAAFAPELKIAIDAWQTIFNSNEDRKVQISGIRPLLDKWLKKSNLDKQLTETQKRRIATIITPIDRKIGGAKKIL